MYNPVFKYTEKLVSALLKAEQYKTNIISTDFSYNTKSELQKKSKTLNIFYLASLVKKTTIEFKDSEKIVNGILPEGIKKENLEILINFRNYMDFAYSDVNESTNEYDLKILLHIYKLIVFSWRETFILQFRDRFPSDLENKDNWGDFVDTNIDSYEKVVQHLNELVEWYASLDVNFPVLVKTSIFAYKLFEIQPFQNHNFISILAIIDFILSKYGYVYKNFASTLRAFYVNIENLKKSLYYSKINYSLEYWIESFVDAFVKEYLEVKKDISTYLMEEEKSKKKPFLNLNKRQIKILQYLQNVPSIKREEYCHIMEVSTMTAFRDLNDLVRKKLLKTEGIGRGTKYKLYSM